MANVEDLNPYSKGEKTPQVETMFNNIASAYDRLNSLMSFGMHTRWRRIALQRLRQTATDPTQPILDVATGTGDVAIHLRRLFPEAPVTGIDLSEDMMDIARRKVARAQLQGINFLRADCLALPFAPDTFAIVTAAYGVRNFADLPAGLRQMHRVLKPGGNLCIIELCEPKSPLMRLGYRLYTRSLVPMMGRMLSGDSRAYTYLPRSVAACPQRGEMIKLLAKAGFRKPRYQVLAPGAVAIYTATK